MNNKIAAFGEIMLRLSAGAQAITDCAAFDACYGGTEANVLACMSALGHEVKYLSALPDNELGDAVIKHLNRFNIDTSDIVRSGDTLGIYFVENGSGSRGANVIYYRKHSEFTRLTESSFDFDKVFDGVKLFHISGISFALSDSSRALAYKLMREAKSRGIKISFDFNYRAKLWSVDEARERFVKAVELADIVLASDLDMSVFLGVDADGFFKRFGAECLVLRNRKVLAANRHSVNVAIYRRNEGGVEKYLTPTVEFDVSEKVGGGDAFDGAVLHKLISGGSLKEVAQFGVGAFAFKHSVAGDTFIGGARDAEQTARKLFKEDFYG